jgi:hypothetical protein
MGFGHGVPFELCELAPWVYFVLVTSEKSLFDICDSAAEAAADARAERDVLAGRLVSHSAVRRWIATWGTTQPLPRPRLGDD